MVLVCRKPPQLFPQQMYPSEIIHWKTAKDIGREQHKPIKRNSRLFLSGQWYEVGGSCRWRQESMPFSQGKNRLCSVTVIMLLASFFHPHSPHLQLSEFYSLVILLYLIIAAKWPGPWKVLSTLFTKPTNETGSITLVPLKFPMPSLNCKSMTFQEQTKFNKQYCVSD